MGNADGLIFVSIKQCNNNKIIYKIRGNCSCEKIIFVKEEKLEIRLANTKDFDILMNYDGHISKETLLNSILQNRIYVIEDGKRFCGGLRYNLFWDNTPFMNLLYILEEDRNKGIGRQLVVHWENQMKKLGYHVVMTSTQENEEAKKFYDRLQYKKVGGFYPLDEDFELIMIKKIS